MTRNRFDAKASVHRNNDFPLVICATLMELAFLSIHLARSHADQIACVLAAYAVTGACFAWLLWQISKGRWTHTSKSTWAVVIGAALIFRATLLPLPTGSSSDAYRYLWEGLIQTHGYDPYVAAPNAEPLALLAGQWPGLHANVNHPDLPTIYPPVAQMLFRVHAHLFGASLLGWKFILLCFDALLVASAWFVLRTYGAPSIGLAALLWCPLLLLETYEGAHLDLVGVALMMLGIAAMQSGGGLPVLPQYSSQCSSGEVQPDAYGQLQRAGPSSAPAAPKGDSPRITQNVARNLSFGRTVAAVALGLSINVKYLWPAVVLVLLVGRAADRRRAVLMLVTAATVVAACWWPYRSGIGSAFAMARFFANQWAFNDPIFELLRAVTVLQWVPMLLVGGLLGGLAIGLTLRPRQDVWQDVWLLVGTALLLSPVAYPWYFLWLVPGLLLRPPVWLVAWVLSVPVLHVVGWWHFTTGRWNPMPVLWVAIVAVPFVYLLKAWHVRLRRPNGQAGEPITPASAHHSEITSEKIPFSQEHV